MIGFAQDPENIVVDTKEEDCLTIWSWGWYRQSEIAPEFLSIDPSKSPKPKHGLDKPRWIKIGHVRDLPNVHCNHVTVCGINPATLYVIQPFLGFFSVWHGENRSFHFVIRHVTKLHQISASGTASSPAPGPTVVASSQKGCGAIILKSGPWLGAPQRSFRFSLGSICIF